MTTPHFSGSHPPPRRVRRVILGIVLLAITVAITVALWPGKSPPAPAPAATPPEAATPTPPPAPPAPPERLRAALGTDADPATDPRGLARTAALRGLKNDLTPEESAALLVALLAPRLPGEAPGPHSVWFHETALALHGQPAIREKFATTLGTVARDASRDPVIRDYALQHLSQLWQNSAAALQATIVETLTQIADQSPAIAPSALLALHRLGSAASPSGQDPPPHAVPDADFAPRLRTLLASGSSASTAARMTALRIVGERRLTGFRDDLARIAADPTSDHPLVRMAAVAAIARLADPGDLPLLRTLDRTDPRVATAIDHAIARLESTP